MRKQPRGRWGRQTAQVSFSRVWRRVGYRAAVARNVVRNEANQLHGDENPRGIVRKRTHGKNTRRNDERAMTNESWHLLYSGDIKLKNSSSICAGSENGPRCFVALI